MAQQSAGAAHRPQTALPHSTRRHGRRLRGEDVPPRSAMFEGRFGRLFRALPAASHSAVALNKLAEIMAAEPEPQDTPETEADAEENDKLPSGYTYLGQFLDHDLTFDPASSLERLNDPDALSDFRTPRFDLDSVYGRGPDDQPYLYDDSGQKFLFGRKLSGSAFDPNTEDLQRNNPNQPDLSRALIGDPRNDENVIVSQLQGIFLRFHNALVDKWLAAGKPFNFSAIQQKVRWHYQWIILHDFLPRILDEETIKEILPGYERNKPFTELKPKLSVYKYKKFPFMPVEFSVAAYRFGHSMVRPIYRLNGTLPQRFHIFNAANAFDGLQGFRAFPDSWAIDWTLYYEIEPRQPLTKERVQPSYKIDTSLVNPLKKLPANVGPVFPNLAERNLLRGLQMGLPSGQAVARHLQIPVLTEAQLVVGKATEDDPQKPIAEIDSEFVDNAPLWYYILAEAQVNKADPKLRGVGARIVAEVFIALMLADSHSFLSQSPGWHPTDLIPAGRDHFDMPALILTATGKA